MQALLFEMNVQKYFWLDGVLTIAYLINKMPSRTLEGKSPIEVLCPSVPVSQAIIKVFGCTFLIYVPKHQRDKLDLKAVKCVSVGYPTNQNLEELQMLCFWKEGLNLYYNECELFLRCFFLLIYK